MLADRGVQAFVGTGLGLLALWSLSVAAAWFGTPASIVVSAVWAVALVPLTVVAWRRSGRLGVLMLLLPTLYGGVVVVTALLEHNPCGRIDLGRVQTIDEVGRSFPPGTDCRVVWQDGSVTKEGFRFGFLIALAAGLTYLWALLARTAPALRAAALVVAPVVVLGVFFFR